MQQQQQQYNQNIYMCVCERVFVIAPLPIVFGVFNGIGVNIIMLKEVNRICIDRIDG